MAAEAKHPRSQLKTSPKFVYARIWLFCVAGVLSIGILVSSNGPTLDSLYNSGEENTISVAAPSVIIAMTRISIKVFPKFVEEPIATAIFTYSNGHLSYAIKSLWCLALGSHAPRVFMK